MTQRNGERGEHGLATRARQRLVRLLVVAVAVTGLMGLGLSQASAAPAPAARAPAATASLARVAAANPQKIPFTWTTPCDQIPASQIYFGSYCTQLGTPWTATGLLQSTTQAVWCWPGFNKVDTWTVAGTGRRTDAATPLLKFTSNVNPPYTTDWVEGELITITNDSIKNPQTYTPALDCYDNYIPPTPKPGS